MDIFEMGITYITSLVFNHPFIDGNKRTALASALTFFYLNGYEFEESYEEEMADKILKLIQHEIQKEDLVEYFKSRLI